MIRPGDQLKARVVEILKHETGWKIVAKAFTNNGEVRIVAYGPNPIPIGYRVLATSHVLRLPGAALDELGLPRSLEWDVRESGYWREGRFVSEAEPTSRIREWVRSQADELGFDAKFVEKGIGWVLIVKTSRGTITGLPDTTAAEPWAGALAAVGLGSLDS